MKQKECLGIDGETVCMDCQRKRNMVDGANTFIIPPVSVETGECAHYQMGEDERDRRVNVVGANGNTGKHYEGGYINLTFLLGGIAAILLVAFVVVNFAGWMVA